MAYNFTAIEKKWQQYWQTNKTFRALEPDEAGDAPKAYVLDMFPYPSGAGLHVGHPLGYVATDIVSRFLRMRGFNVLHPMGWDAFGLPAEQYAIKTGQHPRKTTEANIVTFKRQMSMLGMSYDWDREVDTTDPKYYKWTQWIFVQLFNSYFDPVDNKAKSVAHLIDQLQNENLVVAPDGEVKPNRQQEGLDAIAGDLRVERTWKELAPDEQRDIIDGQRLAYVDEAPVNWCPGLGTVLANEEVIDGKSEVGGFPVERRPMRQWMLRITAYADRLVKDLEMLEWPDSLKEMQRNWIGKSVGAEVDFEIASDEASKQTSDEGEEDDLTITVFTTRPDTLYGATYMVLAPEHPLVDRIAPPERRETIEAYRTQVAGKSERDRVADTKDKTGVFTGAYAINPVNDERIPIYIADYVLMGYGTGAIMAVPAHDERDFAFAKKFELPIRHVVKPVTGELDTNEAYVEEGIAINSQLIDGLPTDQAKTKITEILSREGNANRSVNFKLRDWLFSRQRYWGEPFPIAFDESGNAVSLPENQLPLELPEMADFKPTGTPEPPLSKAKEWMKVTIDGKTYTRETNVMPQWAGSCWYYLRYIDPHNENRFVDKAKEKYWMPVDLYVGGVEHAVLHLLYSRFWHKVLFDLGHVSTAEPFMRLVNQGTILGEEYHIAAEVFEAQKAALERAGVEGVPRKGEGGGDKISYALKVKNSAGELANPAEDRFVRENGKTLLASPRLEVTVQAEKMSKSRGNVVNPDDVVRDYGADSFRLYEMYMGPLEAQKPWNTRDIVGMSRFLSSVYRNLLGEDEAGDAKAKVDEGPVPDALDRMMHRTMKKVGEDISALRFNTAIAELIKLNNEITGMKSIPRDLAENLALMLSPLAPHLAEELWSRLGHTKSLSRRPWPEYDPKKLAESTMELPVQVNGKLRDKITVQADADQESILTTAANADGVKSWLAGKEIKKRLYVPKKLVNFVVA